MLETTDWLWRTNGLDRQLFAATWDYVERCRNLTMGLLPKLAGRVSGGIDFRGRELTILVPAFYPSAWLVGAVVGKKFNANVRFISHDPSGGVVRFSYQARANISTSLNDQPHFTLMGLGGYLSNEKIRKEYCLITPLFRNRYFLLHRRFVGRHLGEIYAESGSSLGKAGIDFRERIGFARTVTIGVGTTINKARNLDTNDAVVVWSGLQRDLATIVGKQATWHLPGSLFLDYGKGSTSDVYLIARKDICRGAPYSIAQIFGSVMALTYADLADRFSSLIHADHRLQKSMLSVVRATIDEASVDVHYELSDFVAFLREQSTTWESMTASREAQLY